jgi:hypothetical protein
MANRNAKILCRIRGSHSGGYKGFDFWDITPCSPFKINRRFE